LIKQCGKLSGYILKFIDKCHFWSNRVNKSQK